MDINNVGGLASGTLGMTDVPLGFGFALANNEDAMKNYASLSETEREHLILRCKDAGSRQEMQKIVDSLVTDADVTAIAQEEREKLS